jgi:hypothetical protein
VASDVSGKPSARGPFQVKATVTQRLSVWIKASMASAKCTLSRMAASQAPPPAGLRNDRNSYRMVSAGARVNRMCWKSSKASTTSSPRLVQRVGETRLLFDLAGADEPMFLTYT